MKKKKTKNKIIVLRKNVSTSLVKNSVPPKTVVMSSKKICPSANASNVSIIMATNSAILTTVRMSGIPTKNKKKKLTNLQMKNIKQLMIGV